MDQWKEERISTSEEVIRAINGGFSRPVSIILIGVDGDFKNSILDVFESEIPGLKVFTEYPPYSQAVCETIFRGEMSLFVLGSKDSINRELRHEFVKALKEFGAKTILGVFAKAKEPRLWSEDMHSIDAEALSRRNMMEAFKHNPPTMVDGYSRLYTCIEGGGDHE